jgi:hypothetical protein
MTGTVSGYTRTPSRAKATFYQTATAIEQRAYKDPNCEFAHPHPIDADGGGNLPPIYLDPDADANYESTYAVMRTVDRTGQTQVYEIEDIPRYEENTDIDTFTVTWVGFSADPSNTTASYFRYGRLVSLTFPVGVGTSNSTSFGITGVPAAIRPTTAQYVYLPYVENSGSLIAGGCVGSIETDGSVDFAVGGQAYSTTSWTASGDKGIDSSRPFATVMYRLVDS